jgi:hypothetical protein
LLILGAIFALAGSCSSDKKLAAIAEGCLINTDCNSPLVCAFRRCHTACSTSRDCQPGQRCVASDRPYHVCQLAEERNCTYNSDCPTGELCGVDLQCRDQCAADRDCTKNQVCASGTCAETIELLDGQLPASMPEGGAEAGGGQPCLYTSQCEYPLICKNMFCAPECLAPADCDPGFDCVNTRCVAGSGTLIGPEGGTVAAMGGKITLTISPGSLRTPVSIVIVAVEAWPDGALGPVFQILPSGLAFDPPATLAYVYTPTDIGAVAPSALKLASAVGSTWIPLASTVDTAASKVSAQIPHLSIYGLVGPSVAAESGTSAPVGAPDAADGGSAGSAVGEGGDAGGEGASLTRIDASLQ